MPKFGVVAVLIPAALAVVAADFLKVWFDYRRELDTL
jgi:hypothetical protein